MSNIISIAPVSILITIVNLLILMGILKHFLFKPVNAILEKRQEAINADLQQASAAMKEGEDYRREYEEKLTQIEQLKKEALVESEKKGAEEYDRVISDARKQAEEILAEARVQSELEDRKRRSELESELAHLVTLATARVSAASEAAQEQSSLNSLNSSLYDTFLNKAGE